MKIWFFAATLLVVTMDQVSKWWIQWSLAPGQSLLVVPGVLQFTLSFNSGIAFGLFPQFGRAFLWISLVVVVAVLIYYLRLRDACAWTTVIASLLVGGSLGNLWDRVRLGHVVDFIDFRVFPVFNIADIAITCATALWVVHIWMATKNREHGEVANGQDCQLG